MTEPVYQMPCGCMIQYSDQSTDICLVVDLVQWCPQHRTIYIIMTNPEGWDTRRTDDTPSRAPVAKEAKRKKGSRKANGNGNTE